MNDIILLLSIGLLPAADQMYRPALITSTRAAYEGSSVKREYADPTLNYATSLQNKNTITKSASLLGATSYKIFIKKEYKDNITIQTSKYFHPFDSKTSVVGGTTAGKVNFTWDMPTF